MFVLTVYKQTYNNNVFVCSVHEKSENSKSRNYLNIPMDQRNHGKN